MSKCNKGKKTMILIMCNLKILKSPHKLPVSRIRHYYRFYRKDGKRKLGNILCKQILQHSYCGNLTRDTNYHHCLKNKQDNPNIPYTDNRGKDLPVTFLCFLDILRSILDIRNKNST